MELFVYFVIALVLVVALRPKTPTAAPASLSDIEVPTAEPGRPVPIVFGTVLLKSPNIVWYGDLGYTPVQSGGK